MKSALENKSNNRLLYLTRPQYFTKKNAKRKGLLKLYLNFSIKHFTSI